MHTKQKLNALSLIRLKGRTPELPADAIVFTTKAFASYPELFDALARGTVAGAPSPVLTAQDMRKIYLHTDLSAMKQVSAMSNMQSPQLRTNPPLLSLRNCSSMTCKKAVNSMHCLKIRTLIKPLNRPRPSGFHPAQMHGEIFPAPCFHVSSGFDKTKRYSRLRKYRAIMYNLHAELILRTTEISACPKRQFLPVRTAERQRSFIRSFIQYGTV